MNFWRSILADDSDPLESENSKSTGDSAPRLSPEEDSDAGNVSQGLEASAWSFGGLIKDLAARSESVIETYRKDLEEFGSGLRKETEIIRVVASRAVKDLPVSLEASATAAHGVLDGVLKSTAEIISREAQIFGSDGESETSGANMGLSLGRYSRSEAQLSALQNDLITFCEDPVDVGEFEKWKLTFLLEEKSDEIDSLFAENVTLDGIYRKVVPSVVDRETFWCRYFYRVDKLKQQETIRANLVKRAMSGDDDDDELSWDVDDEEDSHGIKHETVVKIKADDGYASGIETNLNPDEVGKNSNEKLNQDMGIVTLEVDVDDKNELVDSSEETSGKNAHDDGRQDRAVEASNETRGDFSQDKKEVASEEPGSQKGDDVMVHEEKTGGEGNDNVDIEKSQSKTKTEAPGKQQNSGKSEPVNVEPVVKEDLTHQEADDFGWDEIEDVEKDDEKKISSGNRAATADRAVLRNQLASNEDDEDLSWDIEDEDDEPVKPMKS